MFCYQIKDTKQNQLISYFKELGEAERILKECNELPQLLVMENVPDVISQKNIEDFSLWVQFLDSLGYKSKWKVINGTDFGVPQSRKRCFMVSYLGDYYYDFPKPTGCTLRLKDVLEENVSNEYFLTDAQIISIREWNANQDPLKGIEKEKQISPTITARGAGENHSGMILINESVFSKTTCECAGMLTGGKWDVQIDMSRRVYSPLFVAPTLPCSGGGNTEKKIITKNERIRKLTERECFRLMGVRDEDFERIAPHQSRSSLYHLAGDSIIVDCLMAIFGEMI